MSSCQLQIQRDAATRPVGRVRERHGLPDQNANGRQRGHRGRGGHALHAHGLGEPHLRLDRNGIGSSNTLFLVIL